MNIKNEVLTDIRTFLSFKLAEEVYAANVSQVLNILEMTKITKIPQAPPYMIGVIDLRGSVLPVVDTRIMFGLPTAEYTSDTCIVVLEIGLDGKKVQVGALIDSVQEVLELEDEQIKPPPNIGGKYKSGFIAGVAKVDDKFIMILDMVKIFSIEGLETFQGTSEESEDQDLKKKVKKQKNIN